MQICLQVAQISEKMEWMKQSTLPLFLRLYSLLTWAGTPLLWGLLRWRLWRGKEDRTRLFERMGYASVARPQGYLLWFHAASVGEANSVLSLIQTLRHQYPTLNMLITTGTLTSARLLAERLPKGVIHQFIPLDSPLAAGRFIAHWHPNMALWVESELWPNLLNKATHAGTKLWLINARMSDRSFSRWQKSPATIQTLLSYFEKIFAGSEPDAKRISSLMHYPVTSIGNLKYDTPPLPADHEALAQLQEQLAGRVVWLASSTHPGEEVMAAEAHRRMAQKHANLLTIIVPRHPARGPAIAEMLQRGGWQVSLRSQYDAITEYTQIYIADTLGELGLFYRACPVVFIGGSLVPHGGQNPLEPARLGGAILAGLYMHNFSEICHVLESAGGLSRVLGVEDLSQAVMTLLDDANERQKRGQAAKEAVEAKGGALQHLTDMLAEPLSITVRTSHGKAA